MYSNIIPPYILSNIIDHGSEQQQVLAQETLAHVKTLMAENWKNLEKVKHLPEGQVNRKIYDARHRQKLPGKLISTEGQETNGDTAAEEAWNYIGITYDFFWQIYQRNSLDNKGLPMISTVHYGKNYQNALWKGQQMIFGDGEIFNRFTIAIDIIAHELTHAMTDNEVDLIYFSQAGALNESLSDVFGSMVKQFYLNQNVDQADWIIGEHLLAPYIKGSGLRSMADPGSAYDDPLLGKNPQPKHMDNFITTREDRGGVHINSGIPNRAFYLAATELGGYSGEKAGWVWYDTLCDKTLPQDTDFATFALCTLLHGEKRFNKSVARSIKNAWETVGVLT